jgi:hypothetical protein
MDKVEEVISGEGKGWENNKKEKNKKRKEKRGGIMDISLSYPLHSQEKLFCRFPRIVSSPPTESAPPAQP